MDNTPGTWRLAVKQAASLGGIGLLAGGLAGWLALLGAHDVAARAARAADGYRVLFLLLPAALLLWEWPGRENTAPAAPRPLPGRTAALSLVAGLAGAVLASLAFVAVATQVLVLFGGADPGEAQGAMIVVIGRPAAWALVALVTAVALVLALWAVRRGRSRPGR